MDGSSSVVIPSASVPGGLAREDALFRIVYYGEALRAMTEHVSDTLISGPCVPMIGLLDEAFDRMSETRDSFGPEEFTLFVMSKMLGLCDDVDEARQFQIGAARYILKSAEALPDDYRQIIGDARQMLQRTTPLAVMAEDRAENSAAEGGTVGEPDVAEIGARDHEPECTETMVSTEPSRDAVASTAAPLMPNVAPPGPAPRPAATPPGNQRGTAGSASSFHTRGAATQRQGIHLDTRRRVGFLGFFERFVLWIMLAVILALAVMTGLGLIDFSAR